MVRRMIFIPKIFVRDTSGATFQHYSEILEGCQNFDGNVIILLFDNQIKLSNDIKNLKRYCFYT